MYTQWIHTKSNFDTNTVSRDRHAIQHQADRRKRKAIFSPYFLKMGGKIVVLQGIHFVTTCVQDFVALVLHAALAISDSFSIVHT